MSSYLPENELKEFIASLPTRRLASSALIRDPHGRVLVVEPNYRDGWTLPGGTVEAGEDPRTGCFREVLEEVGLQLPEGRLLVVAHGLAAGIWGDSVAFLYDGGVIPEDTEITLQEEELDSHRWAEPDEILGYVGDRMGRMILSGLEQLETGGVSEFVIGG